MTVILLADGSIPWAPLLVGLGSAAAVLWLTILVILAKWGTAWLQAYMSDARVSFLSLIVMSLLKVDHRLVIRVKIMARQSGLRIDASEGGMSTSRLQGHLLAGGDILAVVQAIIAAQRAGLDLDFDRAAAFDLAGRNVLQSVQTSVSPKVIRCPDDVSYGSATISAVARNGVELRVSACVTVRTNLDRLIGGATEETIIARVGQGIISAIGSADTHTLVLANPSMITKNAMDRDLDSNTAFSIVSIDIACIDVGQNIGARLQSDQADADTRIARAYAEGRRAEAVALTQEMHAEVVRSRANYLMAQSEIPTALAAAFRTGQLRCDPSPRVSLTRTTLAVVGR